MRRTIPVLLAAAALAGCGSTVGGIPVPRGPSGDVIVVGGERDRRDGEGREARRLGVPRGHDPPPGECRVWHPGRPPGQQPPPTQCDRLVGRVPYGAFILYNGREWDTRHDWRGEERRRRGSVPDVILRLMRSLRQ